MRLYVPELKKGDGDFLSYAGTVELSYVRQDIYQPQVVQLHVDVKAAYVQSRVLLKGMWQTEVLVSCHRCLAPVTLQLGEMIYDEFTHLSKGTGSGYPADSEVAMRDGEHFVFKGDLLELDDYFTQLFYMSQPLKVICRDDCQGLCSACGVNRNLENCSCEQNRIDPRWSALDLYKENF